MQIFDQEVERHSSPLVIRPVSARANTAAAIGRTRAEIHCGAEAERAMHPRDDWIRSQNSDDESAPNGLFRAAALSYSARDPRFAQAGIGDWSREPGECPLSAQVFMTLMQKIHTLTDN
ncbi:hypothetical protein ACE10Z_42565 [Bradyrhizobium sp. Pha-3]|uniref:hypothetical protein n=1 Tax=Bradyrhizobium sp. Pha-3 TaxID=208375 RepID=UPI0035D50962